LASQNAWGGRVQLSVEGTEALRTRAQQDVDEGAVPSCQYALALDGEVLVRETLGAAPADARFSIWSSTKPVFASVVWQLIGDGALDPAAPVVELWPEFGARGKEAVTLEHLLLFTAGFPEAVLDLTTVGDRDARVRQMEQWELAYEPGTAYAYHGLSAHWVMAELVARVTGSDHRLALRERVLDPLGLDRLELGLQGEETNHGLQRMVRTGEPSAPEDIAAALGLPDLPPDLLAMLEGAAGGDDGESEGEDSLFAFQQPHVLAAGMPGGGAVSDAASVALFYQALLHDPKGLWDAAVLHDVTTNVRNTFRGGPLQVIANRTLGLEVQGSDPTAKFRSGSGVASPQTFGHGGAAGQVAWADPVSGLSFVYLTNGLDQNILRQSRRGRELTQAAVACVV
jgi:CubicO group peptidase (beta-lactamase class C family)